MNVAHPDLQLSQQHKERLKAICKDLSSMHTDERTFIKMELLFFEALTITREYGNDVQENHFLAELKQLQENEYARTQEKYSKSKQREHAIKNFKTCFKRKLSSWL